MSEIVFQGEPTECGLAALATISNILGQPIKIEELRKHDVFTTGGVAMDVLSQLANKYELAHDIVAFTPEDIMDLTCPSILHLKGNHYVVLKKVTSQYALILNPAMGEQIIPLTLFCEKISGYGLLFQNIKQPPNIVNVKNNKIFTNIKWSVVILGLLLLCINMVIPILFIDGNYFSDSLVFFIFFIVAQMLLYFFSMKFNAATKKLKLNMFHKIGISLFHSMIYNKLNFFERRVASDVRGKFEAFIFAWETKVNFINIYIINTVSAVLCMVVLIYLNITLSVITLSMLMITAGITFFFKARIESKYFTFQEFGLAIGDHLISVLKSIVPIKSAGAEKKVTHLYSYFSRQFTRIQSRMIDDEFNQGILTQIVINTEMVIVFIVSYYQISHGRFLIEHMMSYMFVRQLFIQSLQSVFSNALIQGKMNIDCKRGDDINCYEKEPKTKSNIKIKDDISLSFYDLQFCYYSGQSPLFSLPYLHLNFRDCLLIKGKSGAGKSTLLKVMSGLYVASDESVVHIDNFKINSSLLRTLTYLHEADNHFFTATIIDNITFFDPKPDVVFCHKLLQKMGLLDQISSLNNGIYEQVSEEVHPFSYGQKKRLLLCRALYSSKPIILLDEPTSNLDIESAECVKNALFEANKTLIIATHDKNLDTISNKLLTLN